MSQQPPIQPPGGGQQPGGQGGGQQPMQPGGQQPGGQQPGDPQQGTPAWQTPQSPPPVSGGGPGAGSGFGAQPAAGGAYAGATGPVGPGGRPLSEWWKRLVAAILDNLIIGIPANIIGGLLFSSMFAASEPSFDPVTGEFNNPGFVAGILAAQGAFLLAWIVFTAAYYIYLHGSSGQTLGKKVMKIMVVDETSGGTIGYGRAAKRWVIPGVLSVLTCGIVGILDGIWPLFDAKRQAWHDKFASSQVVDVA